MRYQIEELENCNIIFGKDVKARVIKLQEIFFIIFEDNRISDILYMPKSIIYTRLVKKGLL